MARYANGFLVDDTGAIMVTTVTTGARMVSGFLRAPDGSLVIVNG